MNKNWTKLNRKELMNHMSKFSLKQFWDYISDNQEIYNLEIRMEFNKKNVDCSYNRFDILKSFAKKYFMSYVTGGLIVKNFEQFNRVIKTFRNVATMWYGINSRKKNYNVKFDSKYKTFGSCEKGGCGDHNVNSINFLFIDIDRKIKNGVASSKELTDCNMLCNDVLNNLKDNGLLKNYMKIMSGHGVQCIIKLDIQIKLPQCEFDAVNRTFNESKEFEITKNLLRNGIGNKIEKFLNKKVKYYQKFDKDFNAEIDNSCFRLSNVGCIPFTKNFKYNKETWRGIVEFYDSGINEYLTDLVYESQDTKSVKYSRVFNKSNITISDYIRNGFLNLHPLSRLLLDNNFPAGGINNTLWFQFKCLLRDSKYYIKTDEFKKFHRQICKKHNRSFTTNFPDKKCMFNKNVVNNYCIHNLIPPIYEIYPERKCKQKMFLWCDKKEVAELNYNCLPTPNMNYEFIQNRSFMFPFNEIVNVINNYNILESVHQLKLFLNVNDYKNYDKYCYFIQQLKRKYDDNTAIYFHEYVNKKILNYR